MRKRVFIVVAVLCVTVVSALYQRQEESKKEDLLSIITPRSPVERSISSRISFDREYSDPKNDVIVVENNGVEIVDLTGWALKSVTTGSALKIRSVIDVSGASHPVRLESGSGVFIVSAGSSTESYGAEGEYHLFFDAPVSLWNLDHDTIQLLDAEGEVADSISY